jgi:hypothetical protein
MNQLSLDLDLRTQGYKVYINSRLVQEVATEDDAWAVIDQYPFGSLYEIHDDLGCVPETIPF